MNTYLIVDEQSGVSAIVDPGAEPETILEQAKGTQVAVILITHGHPDHIGALEEVRQATGAQVYMHSLEAQNIGLAYDWALNGGESIRLGEVDIMAIHTPGHTAGMLCYLLPPEPDGTWRAIVGDAIFVGGPGHTESPEAFATTMRTMQEIIFLWPDDTIFYPGHGPSGKIGEERKAYEAFLSRGWEPDVQGDVTWV